MELFSLGIGNYTETDIREAAKAFTGYEIKDGKGTLNAAPARRRREDGLRQERQVQGRGHRAALPRAARLPAVHRPQAVPLPRQRVGRRRRPELIDPLAEQYREWDFDTGKLVATMLRSNLFFSPAAYRAKIKSPVEFAVGHRPRAGRHGGHAAARRGARRAGAGAVRAAVGEGLGRRPGVAQRPDAPRPQQPRAGADLDRGRAVRPPLRPGRAAREARRAATTPRRCDFLLDVFLQGDVPAAARDEAARLPDDREEREVSRCTGPPTTSPTTASAAVAHLVLTLPEFQLN